MSKEIVSITHLKWSSKVMTDILSMFNTRIGTLGITTEKLAEELMLSEQITKGILTGNGTLPIDKFLVICKVVDFEPKDVISAMCNNNAGMLKAVNHGRS